MKNDEMEGKNQVEEAVVNYDDSKPFVHLHLHTYYTDGKEESLYFPEYDVSVGTDALTHLVILGKAGLKRHYGLDYDNPRNDSDRGLIKRFDYEVGIIAKMGFVNHFLLVADIIQWARRNNVPVSPGYGSATGSLVAYSLDITQIDPVMFNLIFEHFINPERDSPPYFGIEFCEARCECIIDYVRQKHGREPCARIVTYEEPGAKRVVRSISRVLDMALREVAPLEINVFGQETLTVLKEALDLVKQVHEVDIDLETIPLDDPATFELFQRADTVGVFQLDSAGMRKVLKELKPDSIEEIIAILALYRPGAMNNIPTFLRRKKGLEKVRYDHPLLEPILKETYGIFVYQEQIQCAAQVLAGYSLGRADILRRAMGKKKVEEMIRECALFVEGCNNHIGLASDKAEEIFDNIERVSGYSFNKAHAVAYSVLAYRAAYMKAHYPFEFKKALECITDNYSDIPRGQVT